ncbi:alpha/beta fold hydrolase [Rhodothermus profundi]|uniref:Pimeloyl-ACP methyl ester carboxylesterase n=1 Tax=Rhodothermus profundi TaxID=633813 RepID=A0A1M6P9X8_9BACT|nr:alpha/beta hydrolase [Rhodothermus profundi]SHK04727.1 Pimeloyl-ACP methyl ester carboxylesterase [Rhodothermus profundi]
MVAKRLVRVGLGLVLILFILAAIGYVWLHTPSIPRAELEQLYANVRSQFLDLESGTRIHFRDEGPQDAPLAVVLLHGLASSLHTWEGWVKMLADRYRVVTLDLPGHGLTGRTVEDQYDRVEMVAAIAAVVDQLGLERFVIGGNSMGGEMAMAYTLAHPERVVGLILVNSAGLRRRSSNQQVPIGFRIAQLSWVRPLVQHITPRALIAHSVAAVYANPDQLTPEVVDRYWKLLRMEGSRLALMKRFVVMVEEPPLPVEQIKQPALVLWGREDRLIPLAIGEVLAQRLPHARLVVLDGLGHVPQEEDPVRSLLPVEDFLVSLLQSDGQTESKNP